SPKECKRLGRKVSNFEVKKWNENKEKFMYIILKAKFSSNEFLKNELLNTGDKIIVECAPFDKEWGIGINVDEMFNGVEWKGDNISPNLLSPFYSTPLNISSTLIPIPHSLSKVAHSTIILFQVLNNSFFKNSLPLNLAFKIIYINFSLFSFHFFSSKLLTFLPNLLHSFGLLLFKIKHPISSSLNNFALQYIKACSLLLKFTPLILKLHL